MRKLFAAVVFAALLSSCVSIRYISHPPANVATEIVLVRVDVMFSEQDKRWIDQAILQWNRTLNGYMRLEVISYDFDMTPDEMAENDIFILKVKSDSDIIPTSPGKRVLGWTNALGGKWIWIVKDRIYESRLIGVVMHEIGHSVLSVDHLGRGSLMSAVDGGESVCIDEETVREVARLHHWDPEHMVWCAANRLQN